MSVVIEGPKSFLLADQAWILDADGVEMAWAERYVAKNPAYKWILGRYVQANEANSNGHIFDLDELRDARHTVVNAPLNIGHKPHDIRGTFVAQELIYPTNGEPAASLAHPSFTSPVPFMEALAAYWHFYFRDEFDRLVMPAYSEGALFYSMEAIPKAVICRAVDGCGREFAYKGRQDPSYCDHLNQPLARKQLKSPHFTAGALIIPPLRPGWKDADITQVATYLEQHVDEAQSALDQVQETVPHLDASQWEAIMRQLVGPLVAPEPAMASLAVVDGAISEFGDYELAYEVAREFTPDKRKDLAKRGIALPDGSYPIATVGDLKNAIQAIGRAKDPAAAKAHIKRRAKALGASDLVPDGW